MDLFELLDWKALGVAGIITIIVIAALTTIFDKFFIKSYRKKILTLITALVVTVISVEINWIEWQSMAVGWLLTFGTSVLIYQYLGVEWLKKYLTKMLDKEPLGE